MDYDMFVPVTYCKYGAKIVGVYGSIMYSELVRHFSLLRYNYKKSKEEWDGWFSLSVDEIQNRTGLNQDEQSEGIKMLKKHECLDVKSIGLPAVRHFYLKLMSNPT